MELELKQENDKSENNVAAPFRCRSVSGGLRIKIKKIQLEEPSNEDESSTSTMDNVELEYNQPSTSRKFKRTPKTTKRTRSSSKRKSSSCLEEKAPVTKKSISRKGKKKIPAEKTRSETKNFRATRMYSTFFLNEMRHSDEESATSNNEDAVTPERKNVVHPGSKKQKSKRKTAAEECNQQIPSTRLETNSISDRCSEYGISNCHCCRDSAGSIKVATCLSYGIENCKCCPTTTSSNSDEDSNINVDQWSIPEQLPTDCDTDSLNIDHFNSEDEIDIVTFDRLNDALRPSADESNDSHNTNMKISCEPPKHEPIEQTFEMDQAHNSHVQNLVKIGAENVFIKYAREIKAPEKTAEKNDGQVTYGGFVDIPSTSTSIVASIPNFALLQHVSTAIPEPIPTTSNNETSKEILWDKLKDNNCQTDFSCVNDTPPSHMLTPAFVPNYKRLDIAGLQGSSNTINIWEAIENPSTKLTSNSASTPSCVPTIKHLEFPNPLTCKPLNCWSGFCSSNENYLSALPPAIGEQYYDDIRIGELITDATGTSPTGDLDFLNTMRSDIGLQTSRGICEVVADIIGINPRDIAPVKTEELKNGPEVAPMDNLNGSEDNIMDYVHSLNLNIEEQERECRMRMQRVRAIQEKTLHVRYFGDESQPSRSEAIEISDDEMPDSSTQYTSTTNSSEDPGSDMSVEFVGSYIDNNIPSTSRGRFRKSKFFVRRSQHTQKLHQSLENKQAIDSSPEEKKGGITDCAVCFEPLNKVGELSSTTCGHVFCTKCIKNVIKLYKRCPICRSTLNSKKVHPIFLF